MSGIYEIKVIKKTWFILNSRELQNAALLNNFFKDHRISILYK